MAIDSRWITKLQGRDYVTFPGLLDLAHQTGCVGIVSELVQIPTPENGNVAITKATVTFLRETGIAEGEWREQVWVTYGDASPANVNRMIATALIRMSETRAIGRALRMACNVGQTMLEELPDMNGAMEEDREPAAAPTRAQGTSAPNAGSNGAMVCSNASCGKPLTKGQNDVSLRSYGQPLCPACQKHFTRVAG